MLRSCILPPREKERLGRSWRKALAIPNGDVQGGQEVSKWGSGRNVKQLHLGTDWGSLWLSKT